jgi:hypothetical protein
MAECPPDFHWVQDSTAVGSPSYTVPAGGGVITSWSHDRGPALPTAQLRLKTFRKTGTNAYLTVGESNFETLTAAGVNTFPTRVPVQGGDLLGLRITTDFISCRRTGSTGDLATASGPVQPDPPVGSSVMLGTVGAFLLNLAATVESDADGDAFGDDTQDKCVGTAGTANGCPSTVTIDSIKQKGVKKVRVKVTVPGSGKLALAGKKLKARHTKLTANTKQRLTLALKLTKRARFKLIDAGKVKVKLKATYTPPGGTPGTAKKKKKLRS